MKRAKQRKLRNGHAYGVLYPLYRHQKLLLSRLRKHGARESDQVRGYMI